MGPNTVSCTLNFEEQKLKATALTNALKKISCSDTNEFATVESTDKVYPKCVLLRKDTYKKMNTELQSNERKV